MNRMATSKSETALVTLWVYSMKVCVWAALGRIAPLHRGQWLPHPAPDPLARTYAPQRITATLYATMNHAKLESETPPCLEMLAGVVLWLARLIPSVRSAAAA